MESVKSVSDLVAPINGRIEEVNEEVVDNPLIINEDNYGEGWLILVSQSNMDEDLKTLMSFEESVEWHKELAKES